MRSRWRGKSLDAALRYARSDILLLTDPVGGSDAPVYYPKSHIAPAARLYSSMQIDLTEEQRLLRETCREFAEKELRPNARRWDREHRYPADTVKRAFELGLGGVAVPAEWGGAGMDNVAYAPAIEEISPGRAPGGRTLSVDNPP